MKQVIGWLNRQDGKKRFVHGGLKSKEAKLLSTNGSLVRIVGVHCDRADLGKVRRAEGVLL